MKLLEENTGNTTPAINTGKLIWIRPQRHRLQNKNNASEIVSNYEAYNHRTKNS